MPGASVYVSTGCSITFVTSSFTANLLSVALDAIARAALETSHMGIAAPASGKLGNKTFTPGKLSDPGSIKIKIQFNPDNIPPIDAAPETIRVTWPLITGDTTAAKWEATGFMTDFNITAELDTIIEAEATVKLSGNITRTAAA